MELPELNGHLLVICPHFDDACFSVGGLLYKRSFASITILTVFSKSYHAPKNWFSYLAFKFADHCQLTTLKRLIVNLISLQRKKEDFNFCRRIGAIQSTLPFNDSSLRGLPPYCCLDKCTFSSDPLFSNVVFELQKWIISNKFSSILCPLAVGNQLDHLIVLYAVLSILKNNNHSKINAFFYEDLPYSYFLKLDSISELARNRLNSDKSIYVDITIGFF